MIFFSFLFQFIYSETIRKVYTYFDACIHDLYSTAEIMILSFVLNTNTYIYIYIYIGNCGVEVGRIYKSTTTFLAWNFGLYCCIGCPLTGISQ